MEKCACKHTFLQMALSIQTLSTINKVEADYRFRVENQIIFEPMQASRSKELVLTRSDFETKSNHIVPAALHY